MLTVKHCLDHLLITKICKAFQKGAHMNPVLKMNATALFSRLCEHIHKETHPEADCVQALQMYVVILYMLYHYCTFKQCLQNVHGPVCYEVASWILDTTLVIIPKDWRKAGVFYCIFWEIRCLSSSQLLLIWKLFHKATCMISFKMITRTINLTTHKLSPGFFVLLLSPYSFSLSNILLEWKQTELLENGSGYLL